MTNICLSSELVHVTSLAPSTETTSTFLYNLFNTGLMTCTFCYNFVPTGLEVFDIQKTVYRYTECPTS